MNGEKGCTSLFHLFEDGQYIILIKEKATGKWVMFSREDWAHVDNTPEIPEFQYTWNKETAEELTKYIQTNLNDKYDGVMITKLTRKIDFGF